MVLSSLRRFLPPSSLFSILLTFIHLSPYSEPGGGGEQEYAECELQLGNKAHAEKLQKASVHILEQVHGETDVAVAEGKRHDPNRYWPRAGPDNWGRRQHHVAQQSAANIHLEDGRGPFPRNVCCVCLLIQQAYATNFLCTKMQPLERPCVIDMQISVGLHINYPTFCPCPTSAVLVRT